MERSVVPKRCHMKWQTAPNPVAVCLCGVVDTLISNRMKKREGKGSDQSKAISRLLKKKNMRSGSENRLLSKRKSLTMELEHLVFLKKYGRWVDQYVEVVEQSKKDRTNAEYIQKIMELKNEGEKWQKQIGRFLKNKDFKERYLKEYKRFANAVESDVEE